MSGNGAQHAHPARKIRGKGCGKNDRAQRGANGFIERSDEYYTQAKDVAKILPYVRAHMERRAASPDYKGGRILCPFDCDKSEFAKQLKSEGYNVDNADLNNGHKDFFTDWDLTAYDLIISNPPFSIWRRIHTVLLDLNVPFCMLTRWDGLLDSNDIYRRVERAQNTYSILFVKGTLKFLRDDGRILKTPYYISWVSNHFAEEQAIFID